LKLPRQLHASHQDFSGAVAGELKLPHQLHASHQDFSGAIAGEEKEDLCKGSFSHTHSLLCFIVLLYFIFTCIILSKTQKKLESLIIVFTYLLLVC
jgi:hypothetical protein